MDIAIREIQNTDFEDIIDYWTNPAEEIGRVRSNIVDKNPTREEILSSLEKKLGSDKPTLLMVAIDGKLIGMHTITALTSESAEIHAHYWDVNYIGKGFGKVSGLKAGKIFMESHGLKYLYLNNVTTFIARTYVGEI